jgi:hypothetical protein
VRTRQCNIYEESSCIPPLQSLLAIFLFPNWTPHHHTKFKSSFSKTDIEWAHLKFVKCPWVTSKNLFIIIVHSLSKSKMQEYWLVIVKLGLFEKRYFEKGTKSWLYCKVKLLCHVASNVHNEIKIIIQHECLEEHKLGDVPYWFLIMYHMT